MQHSESVVIVKPGFLSLALSLASKIQESHLLSLSLCTWVGSSDTHLVCMQEIEVVRKPQSLMRMARSSLYCPLSLLVWSLLESLPVCLWCFLLLASQICSAVFWSFCLPALRHICIIQHSWPLSWHLHTCIPHTSLLSTPLTLLPTSHYSPPSPTQPPPLSFKAAQMQAKLSFWVCLFGWWPLVSIIFLHTASFSSSYG